jgi:predicted lipoprotein with Yx(FWY)xxD motif
MTLRTASALAAVAATLLVAGCGGSDNDSTEQAASAPTTAVAGDLGRMLVDAEGRTLYVWAADQGAQSTCDGPCAEAWPPVTTVGEPKAGDGADASLLATSKRADGTLGVTYDGHPLYYFAGDSAAGDANGQGSDGFGATWSVVSPAGDAIAE